MDDETKRLLGKILGEVYRIQAELDRAGEECAQQVDQERTREVLRVKPGTVYGLLNGFEEALAEEIPERVSRDELRTVRDLLKPYHLGEKEADSFQTLKGEAFQVGVDEGRLISILKYLKGNDSYETVINQFAKSEERSRGTDSFDIDENFD